MAHRNKKTVRRRRIRASRAGKSTTRSAKSGPVHLTIVNPAPKAAPQQKGTGMARRRRSYFGKRVRRARRGRATSFRQMSAAPRPAKRRALHKAPQGGKFLTKEDAGKVVTALPGTALMLAGAGMAAQLLKSSPTVADLKKKVPGGGNTLALGVGLAVGYLGYKYRALIALLSGLGLAAYALVKFATKESRLLGEDGSLALDDSPDGLQLDDGGAPSPEPAPQKKPEQTPTPNPETVSAENLAKAQRSFTLGSELLQANIASGQKDLSGALVAINHFSEALRLSGDPNVYFALGKAFHVASFAASRLGMATTAQEKARGAIIAYRRFIEQARPSKTTSGDQIASMKEQARSAIDALKQGAGEPSGDAQELPAEIRGVDISGLQWVEGDDDDVEGDDDDVEGDDDDVEGDDDDVEGDDDDE